MSFGVLRPLRLPEKPGGFCLAKTAKEQKDTVLEGQKFRLQGKPGALRDEVTNTENVAASFCQRFLGVPSEGEGMC